MSDAKEQARHKIRELVELFRALPESERQRYNEQQTRLSFILPLFEALGWDIRNPAEMSAEEQISRGFVDFGFYLSGIPVFYLETKKIPEDINRPEWGKQAINYSWLRGVTWAVLSDFKGLKVFNAEVLEKVPARAIFLDLHWERYADEDFDKLWLLSKEAMLVREIDKVAEGWGKKARKKPVSELLFAQLTTWRRAIFREMQSHSNLFARDTRKLDEAVQRFLDRLVFIRTVEDRGVESPRLQAVLRQYKDSKKKGKNLFKDLVSLFHEMDTVYNARLFAQHQLDMLEMNDDILLEDIINGLYDAPGGYDRYDFNAISADVLGNIYEQYLSFKATDPTAKDAIDPSHDKQSKRKKQGIFYTPQYVVRYIVQQTLGKLLEDGADPYTIRILDPSCGSGSFLIEAFDVLDRHLAQHGNPDDQAHPRKRRLRILQENLYGVDLDPQAVEVAQLNLLLRAANERSLLPMLTNIKVGDSLIDDPDAAGETAFNWTKQFPEVMEKGGFDVVIGNPPYVRIQTLPKEQVAWLKNQYESPTSNYDLYVPFIERGLKLLNENGSAGFIVPNKFFKAKYGTNIRQLITTGQHLSNVVNFGDHQIFDDATTYTSIVVLSKKPSPHFFYTQVQDLLGWIEGNGSIRDKATAPTASSQEWNFVVGSSATLYERLRDSFIRLGEIAHIFVGLQTSADQVFILDYVEDSDSTIKLHSKALSKVVELEQTIVHPVVSGVDVKRYAPLPKRQYILFPYDVDFPEVSFLDEPQLSKRFPKALNYLLDNKELLAGRERGRFADDKWYRFGRSQNLGIQEQSKLCVPRLVSRLHASIDFEGIYYLDNVDVGGLTLDRDYQKQGLLYIMGLINSKLLGWYFPYISVPFRGGYYSANRQYLEQLPIRLIDFNKPDDVTKHQRMVEMVEEMIAMKQKHTVAAAQFDDSRHDLAVQIERLDAAIDTLVYELYGLSESEIAIVEGRL